MAEKIKLTRRNFLMATGIAAGAAALGTVHLPSAAAAASNGNQDGVNIQRGRMFFTNDLEFSIVSSAAERIFPKDSSGPGAIELAVPYFIDNQLAGAWGYNAREYMEGPFAVGAPTQGPQSPLNRREMFKQGIYALNDAAQKSHKQDFPNLSAAQQDEILKQCEAGRLPTQGFTSDAFFTELLGAVLGGLYADPLYNGNNNMNGWRLKDYPGAQMSYTFLITNSGFEEVPPISLASMQ